MAAIAAREILEEQLTRKLAWASPPWRVGSAFAELRLGAGPRSATAGEPSPAATRLPSRSSREQRSKASVSEGWCRRWESNPHETCASRDLESAGLARPTALHCASSHSRRAPTRSVAPPVAPHYPTGEPSSPAQSVTIWRSSHARLDRHPRRPVRDPRCHWGRRHGRGLRSPRYPPRPRCSDQGRPGDRPPPSVRPTQFNEGANPAH